MKPNPLVEIRKQIPPEFHNYADVFHEHPYHILELAPILGLVHRCISTVLHSLWPLEHYTLVNLQFSTSPSYC